jgi:hypothetical protein
MSEDKKKDTPVALLEKKAKEHRTAAAGYRADAAEERSRAAAFQAEHAEYAEAAQLLSALPKKPEKDPLLQRGPLFEMSASAERTKKCAEACLHRAELKAGYAMERDAEAVMFEEAILLHKGKKTNDA